MNKLPKILFWANAIILSGCTILFFKNNWAIVGIISSIIIIGGLLAYQDIVKLNQTPKKKTLTIPRSKSRRAAYFKSLSDNEKALLLDKMHKLPTDKH